tara:strand:+ start:504 stop:1412 length:909 start_codon:yes stop_codon:yes gene_type:complete
MQHKMIASNAQLDWNDIPILLTLAREGTMRRASARLGMDTSTISRRVAAAEARLQTRLFVRASSGYVPTDAGRTFLAAAGSIEGNVNSLVSATQAESEMPAGSVRITSVDTVLNDWLIPNLPGLVRQYPGMQVTALSDNNTLSFMRSEADLALRVARPREDAALLMRRIGSVGVAIYGARKFIRTPRKALEKMPWLAFNRDLSGSAESHWMEKAVPDAKIVFRCSSVSGLLKACEAGLGLALLPCFAVQSRKLLRLSKGVEYQRELWLLSHRDTASIRRFRVVSDWIAARANEDQALLSGKR